MRVLVTGAAGFIGFHAARLLLGRGDEVFGVDSLNDFYDPCLKRARLDVLFTDPNFHFAKLDLSDSESTLEFFASAKPDTVIHLAAQAGIRYSVVNPAAYMSSNFVGFLNMLEGCRRHPVRHLVFASSSSVYGANTKMPYAVGDPVDHPINLYAASKKSNELMAHAYSHLYSIPTTGLRFFTVYGPWGRPDMAIYKFTARILAGEPIDVYGNGQMSRDFTYVDDIVDGLTRVHDGPPKAGVAASGSPFRIYNIGNHSPTNILEMIKTLERCIGKEAIKNMLPMQAGDVVSTFADISDISRDFGFSPKTSLDRGLGEFVCWYREFHGASARLSDA